MKTFRPIRYRYIGTAVALVAVGTLLGGGAVWARGTASEITACVERGSGYLKVGVSCGSGQTLTWNQLGPQGPKGDAGPPGPQGPRGVGLEPPTKAEVALHKKPPKALTSPPKKPFVKLPGPLAFPPKAVGQAYSSFHDEHVPVAIATGFGPNGIEYTGSLVASHLDVPAGKYVVVAKAQVVTNDSSDPSAPYDHVSCTLVAGYDFDMAESSVGNTLALNVVHVYAKSGSIALRCLGVSPKLRLRFIKITAIRVGELKNTWVGAG